MVRSQILKKLCDLHPSLIRADVAKILEIIFIEITNALREGQNIEIRQFGILKKIKRKARIGRNPQNSQPVVILEKYAIRWKMSKNLFNLLNKNFTAN